MCSRPGLVFTSDTDVSALVRDFIRAQPAVYWGRRLPRLIFLQYIPFCSFLAPRNSQVGISCLAPSIKTLQGNHRCVCRNPDGASDCTEGGSSPSGVTQGDICPGFSSPLMSRSGCRGCRSCSRGDGAEDERACGRMGCYSPSEFSADWREQSSTMTGVGSNPVQPR